MTILFRMIFAAFIAFSNLAQGAVKSASSQEVANASSESSAKSFARGLLKSAAIGAASVGALTIVGGAVGLGLDIMKSNDDRGEQIFGISAILPKLPYYALRYGNGITDLNKPYLIRIPHAEKINPWGQNANSLNHPSKSTMVIAIGINALENAAYGALAGVTVFLATKTVQKISQKISGSQKK